MESYQNVRLNLTLRPSPQVFGSYLTFKTNKTKHVKGSSLCVNVGNISRIEMNMHY